MAPLPRACYNSGMPSLPSRTAIHEAGHALVAVILDETVESATVLREGDHAGRVYHSVPRGPDGPLTDATITVAGQLAEEFVCYYTRRASRRSDDACLAAISESHGRQVVEEARRMAGEMLREHWAAVLAVARELDRVGTLGHDGVIEAMERAGWANPRASLLDPWRWPDEDALPPLGQ